MHMCVCLISLNLPLIICNILIYPSIVCQRCYRARSQRHETRNRVSLIRPYSCNTRLLPYRAVSCRILPYPAVSCRILPYPAVSCRILPYPAFLAVSCRMPVTETLTLTLIKTEYWDRAGGGGNISYDW